MNEFFKSLEPSDISAVLAKWLQPIDPAHCSGATDTEVLSFQEGLRRCAGRAELYERIAKRFLDSRASDASLLTAAFECGDLERVRTLSHNMASTAGTLGAIRLSTTAQGLQAALDETASLMELSILIEAFAREHQAVLVELKSCLSGSANLRAIANRKK